jgi:Transposase DDE domain group 1
MRLKVRRLWRAIKRELPIQFGDEQLSSHGGLELVRRYFQRIGLNARIRLTLGQHAGGDYGCTHLVLLVIGLLLVGARRLQHLRYLANDSLFARFCGLSRIPSDRTVVNWLKQFTQTSLGALMRLNRELLYEQIQKLALRRLTIDLDGTVIHTGGKVAWAMRGFNPHHPKDPSYYPLLAPLAQTGQILRLKNRPGNVHDSKGAERFVRELIGEIRAHLGRALTLEFRMDAAFSNKICSSCSTAWAASMRSKYPCVGGPE